MIIKASRNFGSIVFLAAVSLDSLANKEQSHSKESQNKRDITLSRYSVSNAVDKAIPALVNIQVTMAKGYTTRIASGSGFIFDAKNKLVATNEHVIQQCKNKDLTITLNDGRKYLGEVHSSDSLTDLAIVKITSPIPVKEDNNFRRSSSTNFTQVKLGESSNLRLGEWVIALGSPVGMQNSVSCGIVSSINRSASELGLSQRRTDYIQTDAAINQGNSGGPLINLDGEVIGVNTMKLAYQDGISFAVPVDVVKIVLDQLKKKRRVDRPYLGLKVVPVKAVSEGPIGNTRVAVVSVGKNSPAASAGITKGDFILEIDNVPVTSNSDIIRIIGYEVGRTHNLQVMKPNGRRLHVKVRSASATF